MSFCRRVLIHVSSPVKTIAELRRVTKKGGIVAASDVDDGAMLSFPQAPRFFDLWSKFGQWAEARGDDRYIGRQLFSIFSEADLNSRARALDFCSENRVTALFPVDCL